MIAACYRVCNTMTPLGLSNLLKKYILLCVDFVCNIPPPINHKKTVIETYPFYSMKYPIERVIIILKL